jgi:hypothetical protein
VYGDTGFSVDKHLKRDKPLGTIYLSDKTHPIIVTNTAPSETTRSNEIAVETAKVGTVTAVVAVMSIFSKKRCKLRSANHENDKPSCQKAESANFPDINSCGPRNLSQKLRKDRITKKLAPVLKNL